MSTNCKLSEDDKTYKAIKTFVKLGKSSDNYTEVLEGISSGDQLVEDGIRLVEDQQMVKVIQS